MTALAFVGYLIGWFVVAVVLARRNVMRVVACTRTCRAYLYSSLGYSHDFECENRMVPAEPWKACIVALVWPIAVAYLAVDKAASWERKEKRLDPQRVAALEKELGMDEEPRQRTTIVSGGITSASLYPTEYDRKMMEGR